MDVARYLDKALVVALAALGVLKLTGVVDWSWWWVTAPLWGGALLVVVGYALIYYLDKQGRR